MTQTPYHYTFAYMKEDKSYYVCINSSEKNYEKAESSLVEKYGIVNNEFALVNFYDETTEEGYDHD